MNWRKLKIGDFLTERPIKYKPDQANKLNLKRIDKIDFKGNIHLGPPRATKTNMILVKNGDLVISGINAEKGAVAVYKNNEDALASSHYSSYEYNSNIIDIEFLRWLLQSHYFRRMLTEQSNSGIKTEIINRAQI